MDKILENYSLGQQRCNQPVQQGIVTSPGANMGMFSGVSTKTRIVPATLAVLVQLLALITVLATSWAMYLAAAVYFNTDLSFPIVVLVLMQALTAAVFSQLFGMAKWWRWIHLGFPVAIWGMSSWHVPNELYLAGFILSLSLFWTTFRTQVPFFPSRPVVWQHVASLMAQDQPLRMIDIGSGLGDMSMHIAKVRPTSHIEGIEIAPLPWLISVVRARLSRSAATFKLGDYRELDFASYDVIFAYLSPAAMLALWQKASGEMRPGSLLVSLEFEIPGVTPTRCIAGDAHSPAMYVWQIA